MFALDNNKIYITHYYFSDVKVCLHLYIQFICASGQLINTPVDKYSCAECNEKRDGKGMRWGSDRERWREAELEAAGQSRESSGERSTHLESR